MKRGEVFFKAAVTETEPPAESARKTINIPVVLPKPPRVKIRLLHGVVKIAMVHACLRLLLQKGTLHDDLARRVDHEFLVPFSSDQFAQ